MPLDLKQLSKLPAFNRERLPGFVYLNDSRSFNWFDKYFKEKLSFTNDDVCLYPSQDIKNLEHLIHAVFEIEDTLPILIHNGCVELLSILIQTFLPPQPDILTVRPSYFLFDHICSVHKCNQKKIPLLENCDLPTASLIEEARKRENVIIILCSPNNPTANCHQKHDIEALLEHSGAMVIVDETYYLYSNQDLSDLVKAYDNLVLLRSFSKIGMAGLRLAYLISGEKVMRRLQTAYLPFQINTLSLKTAAAILSAETEIFRQIDSIKSLRQELLSDLSTIAGITARPSETDFINLSMMGFSARKLYDNLYNKKIITHPVHDPPWLKDCIRVHVSQKKAEHKKLLHALGR